MCLQAITVTKLIACIDTAFLTFLGHLLKHFETHHQFELSGVISPMNLYVHTFVQTDYGQKLVAQDVIISNVHDDHSTTKTRVMSSEAQLSSAIKRIAELTHELDDARVGLDSTCTKCFGVSLCGVLRTLLIADCIFI